jgi:hypothetical protein
VCATQCERQFVVSASGPLRSPGGAGGGAGRPIAARLLPLPLEELAEALAPMGPLAFAVVAKTGPSSTHSSLVSSCTFEIHV